MNKAGKVASISERLSTLSAYQLDSIERIIAQLHTPATYHRDPASDLVSECVLSDFGDALRIHHCFSGEALSKDRFEFALERVLKGCRVSAALAPKGNPGHDITIGNSACSLKTQADRGIKSDTIHISKFMELGKGAWTDRVADLRGLLDRFYAHMAKYDRIFTLRRLRDPAKEYYELVEIPKSLLLEARSGDLRSRL